MQDDVVLIVVRDFQTERADIVWKYTAEEAFKLKEYGEIPEACMLLLLLLLGLKVVSLLSDVHPDMHLF